MNFSLVRFHSFFRLVWINPLVQSASANHGHGTKACCTSANHSRHHTLKTLPLHFKAVLMDCWAGFFRLSLLFLAADLFRPSWHLPQWEVWGRWSTEMQRLSIISIGRNVVYYPLKGPFTLSVSDNSAMRLDNSILAEFNGVTWKWITTPSCSDSFVFNENGIANVIAELSQCWRWHLV